MLTVKRLEIATTMYDARKAMISLMGVEKFKHKVEIIRPSIDKLTKERDNNIIKAVMEIVDLQQAQGEDAMLQIFTLAAGVEIIEPYTGE